MQTSCHLHRSTLFSLIFSCITSVLTLPSSAAMPTLQDLKAVKQQLYQLYLQQAQQQHMRDIQIKIKPFNPTLKLSRCQLPVQFEDKQLQRHAKIAGRHTVKIFCQDPKWKFYASVIINGTLPAVISTQGIMKNAVITESMVQQVWQNAQRVNPRRLIHLKTVIGMRAKRPIPPQKVLTIKDVVPPYLVKAKNEVEIMTKLGSISIKAKGIALKSGVYGEQIPVKNSQSGRVIKGIVIGRNLVEVP